MNTMDAFCRAQSSGRELMVFDWIRAARLIRERQPSEAAAGLSGDWEWTGGVIFRDGKPVERGDALSDHYTYLSSNHAPPELDLDGEVLECWLPVSKTPGWNENTSWPPEALRVLAGEEP